MNPRCPVAVGVRVLDSRRHNLLPVTGQRRTEYRSYLLPVFEANLLLEAFASLGPFSQQTMNPLLLIPTPSPGLQIALRANFAAEEVPARAFPAGDLTAARKALQAKRSEWAALNLRQDWADAAWMRAHLKAAGLRVADANEPATPSRLRSLLRRACVSSTEIEASIGTDLAGHLRLNPGLPLWAAAALILEATGRFTPGTPTKAVEVKATA